MADQHDTECEKAEPGSVCDCDCAGARHAVVRTGGQPAAGAVSKRARKIAERDGRAPVVNRLTDTTDRPARDRAGKPARIRTPDPVRTVTPPPRLTPALKARIRTVRDGLPKDRAQWHRAATEPISAKIRERLTADVAAAATGLAAAEQAVEALYAVHAKKEAAKIARSKDGKAGRYGSKDDIARMAANIAPHRAWDDPEWDTLSRAKSDAQADLWAAERKLADAGPRAREYPKDDTTGLRMPSKALLGHLGTVRDAGRAVLAEARTLWETDPPPPVRDAQALITKQARALEAVQALSRRQSFVPGLETANPNLGRFTVPLPDGPVTVTSRQQFADLQQHWGMELLACGGADRVREARKTVAAHQSQTLHAVLADARTFGGAHTGVTAERDTAHAGNPMFDVQQPRTDWRARLDVAERHFPADWITASSKQPLKVGASRRAYYNTRDGLLSMNTDAESDVRHDGGLDYIDEVTVHEMGHRMEQTIPGLTFLEFAYVRERGIEPDGTVQPVRSLGYTDKSEVTQPDKWGNAYAGKNYERGGGSEQPGLLAWEVFQVGLQDVFGRSSTRYGPVDDPDELQAFVIGALLTLG